ncbi:hypothetical protein AB0M47_07120 [Hamadaea sp. NPDC051192]|uniref:hypothetical protein n=1 Tax=Hamadaea sp. NPDC051192 TaxID=3154940 RepID=UPI003449AB30
MTIVDHSVISPGELDGPMLVPLSREVSWERIQRLSQQHARGVDAELIETVRSTAVVRRGTRMVKPLPARAVAGVLRGAVVSGFCYRGYDTASLRSPGDWSVLGADPSAPVTFVLRWRAVDPVDYAYPKAGGGLSAIPAHERVGPPVLGTGFAPSSTELIPEFHTADFADLPLTANASLIAYTPDGSEAILYTYQPEQRGWLRLAGPQWRPLLYGLPGVAPEQEYHPLHGERAFSRLVGRFQEAEHDAVADPPETFRVLAMSRAARFPVDSLARRTRYARWRGVLCTGVGAEGDWARLRICDPDAVTVAATGAQCQERGVYEVWAPVAELTEVHDLDLYYEI